MTLSIFLCACWSHICLIWKNAYLGLLPNSYGLFIFYFYWLLYEFCVYFGHWPLIRYIVCKYLLPFSGLLFCFVLFCFVSFSVQQLFHVFLFVYFCFCFLCGGRQIRNNIPEIEVSMYTSYVFLEYYGFRSFISLIHSEFIYIYIWHEKIVQYNSLVHSCRFCFEAADCLGWCGHFKNTSFNPWAQCLFPFVCVVFGFCH